MGTTGARGRRITASELLEQRIVFAHAALTKLITSPRSTREACRADFHRLCGLIEAAMIVAAGKPADPRENLSRWARAELGIDLAELQVRADVKGT